MESHGRNAYLGCLRRLDVTPCDLNLTHTEIIVTSVDSAMDAGSGDSPDGPGAVDNTPYQFDAAHPDVAGLLLDRACTDARSHGNVDLALAETEIPDGVPAG